MARIKSKTILIVEVQSEEAATINQGANTLDLSIPPPSEVKKIRIDLLVLSA
jgi:hypothetical protein